MKRKIFVLCSLGAAALFAGGVVAAYTVKDNADKQGIKITPGTITDDKVGQVTLEWGDMSYFTNVQGLSSSEAVTKTINVKATVKDGNGQPTDDVYLGKLDIELKDLSGKSSSATRLIDYLHVKVKGFAYDVGNKAFATEKTTLGEIPTKGENAFATSLDVYSNSTGKPIDFVISLDADATPVMSQIMSDQVYLTVDWNRGNNDDSQMKHVYIPSNGWDAMYVYSYSSGNVQNADWPGIALEKDPVTGMFEGDLANHEYFIFNNGNTENMQQYPAINAGGMSQADLHYSTEDAIYFNWTSHTFTNEEPVQLAPFYLVGEPTAWDVLADNAFALDDANKPEAAVHQYKLVANVETGKEFKVCSGDKEKWLGYENIESDCQSLVENAKGNFKFNEGGEYTFYLKEYTGNVFTLYIAAPVVK